MADISYTYLAIVILWCGTEVRRVPRQHTEHQPILPIRPPMR